MRISIFLTMKRIIVFLLVSLCIIACTFNKNGSFNEIDEWEKHVAKLPEAIWQLFYAVKHELDYCIVNGMSIPSPKKKIHEYKLVLPALISKVETTFHIYEYSVRGNDYILELRGIEDPLERYRANRSEIFIWKEGKWNSLGGYRYL